MDKKRNTLGRGFHALLEEPLEKFIDAQAEATEHIKKILLSSIHLNPQQPRKHFATSKLNELAESIKNYGIIQPLIVRKKSESLDEYELIAGERRLKAAQLAEVKEIPVIITTIENHQLLEIALIENIQRENLNALEEAVAYQTLINKYQYTQQQLAEKIGKDRTTVTNTLRLLQLPNFLQEDLIHQKISAGHARCLLALQTEAQQKQVRNRIIEEELSVRKTEELIKKILTGQLPSTKTTKNLSDLPANLQNQINHLGEQLATKIVIKGNQHKGSLNLHYNNLEELKSLISKIKY